jgi:hypothetical protein
MGMCRWILPPSSLDSQGKYGVAGDRKRKGKGAGQTLEKYDRQ